jgi:hypothetical protein
MMNWYVVQSPNGKKVAEQLKIKESLAIALWLRRFGNGPIERREVPLFNSYVLSSCLKHKEIWFFNQ